MHLGGWSRLGIVLVVFYGILVAFIAYESRPRLEYLESAWVDEAAEVIAKSISKAEGKEVSSFEVREAVALKGGPEPTQWLERVETSPSESQKIFSADLSKVNQKHRAIISTLSAREREHWLLAFAWWAGGILLFSFSVWTIRWVYLGFRKNLS